jgi:hypothetical protein
VTVRGVVRDVIFIGTDTRYVVQVADDKHITARQQNSGDARRIGKGEQVILSWAVENARILLD